MNGTGVKQSIPLNLHSYLFRNSNRKCSTKAAALLAKRVSLKQLRVFLHSTIHFVHVGFSFVFALHNWLRIQSTPVRGFTGGKFLNPHCF